MTALSYWLGVVDEEMERWEALCTQYLSGDRRLAVVASTAIPALIAEVRRLRKQLEQERQWPRL